MKNSKTKLGAVGARALALAAGAALATSPLLSGAASAASGQQAQGFVDDAQHVLAGMERNPDLKGLLKRAQGVLIIPSYGQAGLIVGGRGGEGLVMAHRGGAWTDPAFYHVGGVNIGLQAGAAGGSVAMLLMTPNALNDVMGSNNFSLNANAGLSIVTFSAKTRAAWGRADVIVWADTKGLYGGATVGVSDVAQDQAENAAYYGRSVTVNRILNGTAKNPGAAALARTLEGASRA